MSLRTALLITSTCIAALAAAPLSAQQTTEIDNVAAFARLYGVTRWFYPSDAAATIDWNRFAVEGVRRVRDARTPAELEARLKQLFTPLGPGIQIGTTLVPKPAEGPRDPELVAWHYRGPGFISSPSGTYSAKRINRSVTPAQRTQNAAAIMSQTIAADTLRGRSVRLRGLVRVANPSDSGWAGLWLRVDRDGQKMGFFDNMQNRPVRDTAWREYVIEGTIADDAKVIVFGALSVGATRMDVDAIQISVRTTGGEWTPLSVRDANFENTEQQSTPAWSYSQPAGLTRPTAGAPQGERYARVALEIVPPTRLAQAARAIDATETPITNAVSDVTLTRGLRARVPLSLTDGDARVEGPALAELRAALAALPPSAGRNDTDVHVADVVVAWNVFRHFYPYWQDITVNWDARLRPRLAIALNTPATRAAHLDSIRTLVGELNDGHGFVNDALATQPMGRLPLQFRTLSKALIVTASRDSSVPVGSVVTRINGMPTSTRMKTETLRASGTPQWKQYRAESALQVCPLDSTVTLTIEPPTGPARSATLTCGRQQTRIAEVRPDSLTELEPGIWYVDLTRVLAAQLRPMLPTLAKARGVVFDMRGYPTDAGSTILPHLMRTREDSTDRWMHMPRFTRPFAEVAAWQDFTWSLQSATPQIAGQRVFLTDGRAISYAESVMGYVRDYKLGTIIGSTTAGANGDIATFVVPGGFAITFSGLRVTRHDGRSAYHTRGVSPEIPLEPTVSGIRAGRDEVLARGLSVLRKYP